MKYCLKIESNCLKIQTKHPLGIYPVFYVLFLNI